MKYYYDSWRKNVYSSEIETWFEKENIALVIRNELYEMQSNSLKASRSGLLPVKGIEEHPRTVDNIVYKSDTDSDESSVHDYIPKQSTPVHMNHHNMTHSPSPNVNNSLSPSWNQPQEYLVKPSMMPQLSHPRVAPLPSKNIAQSSMPCVWSYSTQFTIGIAPHHSSNFFHQLRQKNQTKTWRDEDQVLPHSNLRNHRFPFASSGSDMKYQSRSQTQTIKRDDTELGRRHSLYDQFVLNKDPRLQEQAKNKFVTRVSKPQGTVQ